MPEPTTPMPCPFCRDMKFSLYRHSVTGRPILIHLLGPTFCILAEATFDLELWNRCAALPTGAGRAEPTADAAERFITAYYAAERAYNRRSRSPDVPPFDAYLYEPFVQTAIAAASVAPAGDATPERTYPATIVAAVAYLEAFARLSEEMLGEPTNDPGIVLSLLCGEKPRAEARRHAAALRAAVPVREAGGDEERTLLDYYDEVRATCTLVAASGQLGIHARHRANLRSAAKIIEALSRSASSRGEPGDEALVKLADRLAKRADAQEGFSTAGWPEPMLERLTPTEVAAIIRAARSASRGGEPTSEPRDAAGQPYPQADQCHRCGGVFPVGDAHDCPAASAPPRPTTTEEASRA